MRVAGGIVACALLLCAALTGVDADQRRHKPRVNFKGEKEGHSNYGQGFDDRKKYVAGGLRGGER